MSERDSSPGLSFLASILFHVLVGVLLMWAGLAHQPKQEQQPLALELWSASPAPAAAPVQEVPQPTPTPAVVTPPPAPTQDVVPPAPAEINTGEKQKPRPHVVEKPKEQQPPAEPTPHKKVAAPVEAPKPKPVPAPPVKPVVKPQEPVHKAPAPVKPAQAKPVKPAAPAAKHAPAKTYDHEADDLLAGLDNSSANHKANANHNEAGSAHGVAGGAVNGSASVDPGYASKVRSKIWPLVVVPPGASAKLTVVLQVTLLPTLEVRSVRVLQGSGNDAYDQAVQQAVWQAKVFPSLPSGANFSSYRQYRLEFRSK